MEEKLFGIAILTAAAVIFYAASAKNYVREKNRDAYCLLLASCVWSGLAFCLSGLLSSAIILVLVGIFYFCKKRKHTLNQRYYNSKREVQICLKYERWFWRLFLVSFIMAIIASFIINRF